MRAIVIFSTLAWIDPIGSGCIQSDALLDQR